MQSPGERERWIAAAGAQLWSVDSGTGTPMLMFNGGPGCSDYLEPVARLLDKRCRVIRFEPRGCGRSSWDGKYDLDTLMQDAESVRRAYDVDRWIVAGHSAGPSYALAYALRHPSSVIGLIGLCGGSVINDRDWSRTYHERLENEGEERGTLEFHVDTQVNTIGNRTWREYIKRPSLLREVAELDVPAVFINAEKDIRPNWPTQQLALLLKKGKYVSIAGAAHYPWLTHERELSRELDAALDYVAAG